MRKWIPLIAAIVILGGIVWSFRYLRDIHPFGSLAPRLDRGGMANIAMRFRGVRLIGKSNGEKIWAFSAGSIDVGRDRQKAVFKDKISGTVLFKGKPAAWIKSSEIVYGIYTHDILIPGSAEIRMKDGPTLKVKDVYWNGYRSKMVCKGGVDASIAGSTLHGERLTADLDKKEIGISKVRGLIRLDSANPILR